MLIEIHLFLTITAFVLLIIGLTNKHKKGTKKQNIHEPNTITINDTEIRGNIPLLLTAAFLFFFLSYTSLDINYYTCHNQITWMNETAENDTQITNQITCTDNKIRDTPLSSLYAGLGVLSTLLSLFFAINIMRESV